jgi:hypothetical protein
MQFTPVPPTGISCESRNPGKQLIPTEFGLLKDLECYVKLPGDLPVTKLMTPLKKPRKSKKEAFVLREEKKRIYGQIPSEINEAIEEGQL